MKLVVTIMVLAVIMSVVWTCNGWVKDTNLRRQGYHYLDEEQNYGEDPPTESYYFKE